MTLRLLAAAGALLAVALLAATAPAPAAAGTNPSPAEIRGLLHDAAVKWDIPPKILYAIAYQESAWQQFKANGDPLISNDKGIGIMQVTTVPVGVDPDRLKTDIAYNIDVGASILDAKWGYAPSLFPVIGDGSRHCYEDWFFAVWAYNGWVAPTASRTRIPTRSGATSPTAAGSGPARRSPPTRRRRW